MLRRSYVIPAALLGLFGVGASCEAPPRERGRTILLVTVEGLRPDLLKLGGGAIETPTLERLAAAGTVFTDAVSVSPMSRPSAATILTGTAPDRTNVRDSVADRLPAGVMTLAEILTNAGWSSAAFVGSPSCGWGSGLDRGFGLFDAPHQEIVGPGRFLPKPRAAAEVVANAVTWIGGLEPEADAFAWVHLADLLPLPFSLDDVAKTGEAYAAGVKGLDAALSPVLDAAGTRRGLEVIVVATHGMYLGESGRYGDTFWLDRETLAVPLIWTGRRAKPGRDNRPAWLPDVAATIAASAGVALDPSSEGSDLGVSPSGDRKRFAWSWAPDDQLAWPNLAAVATGDGFETSGERPARPRPRVLSEETRRRLAATGLVLGAKPKVWERRPNGSEEITQRLGRGRYLLTEVRNGPARVVARQGLQTYPDDLGLLTIHLYVMHQATTREPVLDTVSRLLKLYPDRQEALHWLAHFEYAAKRSDRAEALTIAAAEVGPKDADLLYDLACARSIAKEVPSALDYLQQAVDAGYRDWDWLDKDPDLAAVRADPGYAALRRAGGQ